MRTFVLSIVCACTLLLGARAASAQDTGTITGSVHDQKSGEELLGANVLVVGTKLGASADLEGKFTIRGVPPGKYQLRFSYVGYPPKLIDDVVVTAGKTTEVAVTLAEEEQAAKEEVLVTAERVLATEAAVLSERKKAATIGDAVSAEQIKRSPDATSGDALKRMTGLSVVDNKYVFIRGVTDRYNGTTLNGVGVTNTDTDVDRKSFSFDLVPANLLENTLVVKTSSPDLPGDFSGGLVQVNTLDFPATRTFRIAVSNALDAASSTKGALASAGGGHDWLANDDGSRSLPTGLAGVPLAQALPNTWGAHSRKTPFNNTVNLSAGDRHQLGSGELGYIGAFSYRTEYQTNDFRESPTYKGLPIFDFTGSRFQRSVLWGALLNVNAKLGLHHKLSFRNNFNRSAQDQVSVSEGIPVSGEFTRRQVIQWTQRSFFLTQLSGEHKLPALGGLGADWHLSYSESQADEPDRKAAEFQNDPYGNFVLGDNQRSWSNLGETSDGAGVDLTYTFNADTKVKSGGLLQGRKRSYDVDAFTTDPSFLAPQNAALVIEPIDQIFAPENYGPGKFRFPAITTFTGSYDGHHDLKAAYAMLDRQQTVLGQRLRLAGGVRLEDSEINVSSIPELGALQPVLARLASTDRLPSANLTWVARENLNFRLAYGQSVNRPEFRELADVLYYDFDALQNVRGNPKLNRALVKSYDARLELFPQVGEVLAGSFFYKDLENAIEERLVPAPDRYVRTWFNSPKGKNYGWELEARRSLGFLTPALRNLSVTGNYTRVISSIEYTDAQTNAQGEAMYSKHERVMQGQSPWTANVSLLFVAPDLGGSVNVLYGRVGRRLDAVGDSRDEDVYEEPRDLLDVAVTQKFLTRWEVKLSAKNLLGQDERRTTGPERATFESISRAPVWTLQLALGI